MYQNYPLALLCEHSPIFFPHMAILSYAKPLPLKKQPKRLQSS